MIESALYTRTKFNLDLIVNKMSLSMFFVYSKLLLVVILEEVTKEMLKRWNDMYVHCFAHFSRSLIEMVDYFFLYESWCNIYLFCLSYFVGLFIAIVTFSGQVELIRGVVS